MKKTGRFLLLFVLSASLVSVAAWWPVLNLAVSHQQHEPVQHSRPLNASGKPVIVFDIHDTLLTRWTSDGIKAAFKLKPTNFCRFLARIILYGIEIKILKRPTDNIENYLLGSNVVVDSQYAQDVYDIISCFRETLGAATLLARLKKAGIPIFVCSNIGPNSYRLLAQRYPALFKHIDGAIISTDSSVPNKDNPAAYRRCIAKISAQLGYKPNLILLIDDKQKNCAIFTSLATEYPDIDLQTIRCRSKTFAPAGQEKILAVLQNC